jgi:tRNA dimethylallyltransferase
VSFSLLAVLGPTASGKSDLAIELAKQLISQGRPAAIINADAMQLYRHMNIGTAKLTAEDQGGIKHHLFDVIEPSEEMTAVQYQAIARTKAEELLGSGITPVFVGGSMFYVSAALDNLDFAPTDPVIREALEAEAERVGAITMHGRLKALDPLTAERIPSQNIRRVIRALEVIEITGSDYQSQLPEQAFWLPTLELGIEVEREVIKERIAKRVVKMWESGLLEEARELLDNFELSRTAKMAIGYQQAFKQLSGEYSQEQAIEETISLTQRYARRQMSWFRRDKRIHWLPSSAELTTQAMERIRLEA